MENTIDCTETKFSPCFGNDCWYTNEEGTFANVANKTISWCWWKALIVFCIGIFFLIVAQYIEPITYFLTTSYQKIKFLYIRLKTHDLEFSEDEGEERDTFTIPTPQTAFFNTKRTEENFIKNNTDNELELPYPYGPEYKPGYDIHIRTVTDEVFSVFKLVSGKMFESNYMIMILFSCFGWGCIGSAVSSVLYLYKTYNNDCNNKERFWLENMENIGETSKIIMNDYSFLPIFLISGYIGFVADRWLQWMVNCHSLQGKISTFGLLCGSAVSVPVDVGIRKHLYKIYRYLNCFHALTYQSVSLELDRMKVEHEFVNGLNLLTKQEVEILLPMDNKIREVLLCWIGNEMVSFLKHDSVAASTVSIALADNLALMRAHSVRHHDLFIRDRANIFIRTMKLFINVYFFLVITFYPFILFLEGACLQPMVLVGITVNTSFFQIVMMLAVVLRNPFSLTSDQIKVNSLLASTDRALFACMRGAFDKDIHGMPDVTLNNTPRAKSLSRMRKSKWRSSQRRISTSTFVSPDAREH